MDTTDRIVAAVGGLAAIAILGFIIVGTVAFGVSVARDSRAMESCVTAGRPYHECKALVDGKQCGGGR